MRNSLPFILLFVVLAAFGCVLIDAPVVSESEIQRGRLVTPGVYQCGSCEEVLAVGWDEAAMLHTFNGWPVFSVAMGGRLLMQVETDDGFMVFWASVEGGRQFSIYDLTGPVPQPVQDSYGIEVDYNEQFDFHAIHGESGAVRRFMEEYAPEHLELSGTYTFVVAANVTQQELEACEAECGEKGGGDFAAMIRGCVVHCVGKR